MSRKAFYAALDDMSDAEFFEWETREQSLLSTKREAIRDRLQDVEDIQNHLSHMRKNRIRRLEP